ncbi:hypothetical protein H4R99_006899 [Coemansia sp. RSA 1722]|nr:hypothetical protein H4R99_006899 [Coemansia sp. RSA 1722]
MYRRVVFANSRHIAARSITRSRIQHGYSAHRLAALACSSATKHQQPSLSRRCVHSSTRNDGPPTATATAIEAATTTDADYSSSMSTAQSKHAEPGVSHMADAGNGGGPVAEYERLVQAGQFIDDGFQRTIVSRLDRLYQELLEYAPAAPENTSSKGMGGLFKVRTTMCIISLGLRSPHIIKAEHAFGMQV